MSTSDNVALVSAFIGPLLTFIGALVGLWVGGRRTKKKAESIAAEAAEIASAEARIAVTADWEAYTGLLMQRLTTVESRANTADERLSAAETRATIAEERAAHWASLYRTAVVYMKQLITWASDVSHLSEIPSAPPELQADL
jgi:hypothetical protein